MSALLATMSRMRRLRRLVQRLVRERDAAREQVARLDDARADRERRLTALAAAHEEALLRARADGRRESADESIAVVADALRRLEVVAAERDALRAAIREQAALLSREELSAIMKEKP